MLLLHRVSRLIPSMYSQTQVLYILAAAPRRGCLCGPEEARISSTDIAVSGLVNSDMTFSGQKKFHRDSGSFLSADIPKCRYRLVLPIPVHKPKGYPENPQTPGQHLKKWRMDQGLKIKEAANLLGVCQQTILNWEAGRRRPREGSIKILLKQTHFVEDFE